MSLACMDGVVVPVDEARVPVTDEGLLRGDGVFEVMRLYDGRPFALADHLERLARSASNLRLELELEAIERDIRQLLAEAEPQSGLVRVLVTRGGRRIVLLEDLPDLGPSMSLGYVTYAPTRVLDNIKSLSYAANMLASRLARERGHDEALLITPHGRVLEAPTASFFWVSEGRVHTPALDDHVLDSITRRRVMESIEVTEAVTTREDLDGADEAFLASTVREVMPVSRIEDRSLAVDGAVTANAAQLVAERIQAELAADA